MDKKLREYFDGKVGNHLLPFYWQHGDHYEKIPEQIERIAASGCKAFCVESRPHRDFCGETWWRDMDLILSEEEISYLEEPYVPHPLAGVMAQNKSSASKEKHVWSTGDQKIGR